MRDLQKNPITPEEVIKFMKTNVGVESAFAEAMGLGKDSTDPICAEIALAVVKAALLIVRNDLDFNAVELLEQAFNCRNNPVMSPA